MSVVPEWVAEAYFIDIIREEVPEFRSIKTFSAKPALKPGENYATLMVRVEVEIEKNDGSSQPMSFMLKLAHATESMESLLEQNDIFLCESIMYKNVVPEMEEMYAAAGRRVKLGARSFSFTKNPGCRTILLQDLRPLGFKNANRLEGLNMEHTEAVLQKMAAWHAASAFRVIEKGPYEHFKNCGFFSKAARPFVKLMTDNAIKPFLQCLKTLKCCQHLEPKIERLQSELMTEIDRMANYECNFSVLNHGDAWSNNIMFQYDSDGKLLETYFVDFQNPSYGSPVIDLYYFIISSVNIDIKLQEFDYFIKYYYDHLVDNLKLLKYPGELPTLRGLHMDLLRSGAWAFLCTETIMSIVLLDSTDTANLDNFMNDTEEGLEFKMLMYTNPRYKRYAEAVLTWLDRRGLLDI